MKNKIIIIKKNINYLFIKKINNNYFNKTNNKKISFLINYLRISTKF